LEGRSPAPRQAPRRETVPSRYTRARLAGDRKPSVRCRENFPALGGGASTSLKSGQAKPAELRRAPIPVCRPRRRVRRRSRAEAEGHPSSDFLAVLEAAALIGEDRLVSGAGQRPERPLPRDLPPGRGHGREKQREDRGEVPHARIVAAREAEE